MSWFDDLSARVQQEAQSRLSTIGSDVQSYIASQVSGAGATVMVAQQPPTGNLSAAQIAAGARGGPAPVAAAAAPAAATQNASAHSMLSIAGLSAPVLLAIGVGAYFLLSSKRRG